MTDPGRSQFQAGHRCREAEPLLHPGQPRLKSLEDGKSYPLRFVFDRAKTYDFDLPAAAWGGMVVLGRGGLSRDGEAPASYRLFAVFARSRFRRCLLARNPRMRRSCKHPATGSLPHANVWCRAARRAVR